MFIINTHFNKYTHQRPISNRPIARLPTKPKLNPIIEGRRPMV